MQGKIPCRDGAQGPPKIEEGNQALAKCIVLTYTAPSTNATKNDWTHYAEGFLDFFQVIKFRFLAFILVPGSARRHGLQKSTLIVPTL